MKLYGSDLKRARGSWHMRWDGDGGTDRRRAGPRGRSQRGLAGHRTRKQRGEGRQQTYLIEPVLAQRSHGDRAIGGGFREPDKLRVLEVLHQVLAQPTLLADRVAKGGGAAVP